MPTDQDDSELMISEEPLDLYWNDNVYELNSKIFFDVERASG